MIGKVIGGGVSERVKIRIDSSAEVNVGDIVVVEDSDYKYLLKIIDIYLESQIPSQFIEDMANKMNGVLFDEKDRFYKIAVAKLLKMEKEKLLPPRDVPNFFKEVRKITEEDLKNLKVHGEIPIGKLRLGSRVTNIDLNLPAKKLVSHHMLVVAATGKGKSNFTKVFVKGITETEGFAAVVFDPHAEYYGKEGKGLRDLGVDKVKFITPNYRDYPGSEPLTLTSSDLIPSDFNGIAPLSEAQQSAMIILHKIYKEKWLLKILTEDPKNIKEALLETNGIDIAQSTLAVLKRKMTQILEVLGEDGGTVFKFENVGASIHERVLSYIKDGKTVIIDTSSVSEDLEKLISSTILNRLFESFKYSKQYDPKLFKEYPELLIVFEEAPRVLAETTGETNIFQRVAREGRKFKVGLCAITQMPSLIPAEILSQMNTKVILGIPSPADRKAVVDSAAQEISDEMTEIQMLDVGEAIITSPFVDFPLPVKIYKFEDIIEKKKEDLVL